MFIRLNSDYFAKRHLETENAYKVCNDKSGIEILGDFDSEGNLVVGPVAVKIHAAFVVRNPAMGKRHPDIITPDSGNFELDTTLTKKQLEVAKDLDWHYRIYFMRIDTPYYPS